MSKNTYEGETELNGGTGSMINPVWTRLTEIQKLDSTEGMKDDVTSF
jgi:hypothetical protein